MSGKKKVKQKSKGRISKEVLEIIPDAEERFQKAFEKLTKRTKKLVDQKHSKALQEKRNLKGVQARHLHKIEFQRRKEYLQSKHQEREARRHKFAYELLTTNAEIEIVKVESNSILERLAEKLYEAEVRRHGSKRFPEGKTSKKEIMKKIISPFRKFAEKDDVLLSVNWNIIGGRKGFSQLMKKHGMIHLYTPDENPLQLKSYMIYNLESNRVKYDSLASKLFSEIKLEISPKKIHHSDLTIDLESYTYDEKEFDCAGECTNHVEITLKSKFVMTQYGTYVDSDHPLKIDGTITFETSQKNRIGQTSSYRDYVSIVGKGNGTVPQWPNSHGKPFISKVWLEPADRLDDGKANANDGFNDRPIIELEFDFGIGSGPFSIGVAPKPTADMSPIRIDGDCNPNELLLHHFIVGDWFGILNPFQERVSTGPYKDGGSLWFEFWIKPDFSDKSEIGKVAFNIPVQFGGYYYAQDYYYAYAVNYVYENEVWDTFEPTSEEIVEYIRGDAIKEPTITFRPSGDIPIEYDLDAEHELFVEVTNNSQVPISKVILLNLVGYNRDNIIYVHETSSTSQTWEASVEDPPKTKGETIQLPFKFATEGIGNAYPIFHIQYSFEGVPERLSFPLNRDFKEAPSGEDEKAIFIVSPRGVENLSIGTSGILGLPKLTWTSNKSACYAPVDDAVSYKIYRNGEELPHDQIDDECSVEPIEYIDTDIEVGSKYTYQVTVVYETTESEPSIPVPESRQKDTVVEEPSISKSTSPEVKVIQYESKLSEEVGITVGFLGNKNTKEVHQLDCVHISRMKEKSKIEIKTLTEAKDMGYNGCYWCLREYDTG